MQKIIEFANKVALNENAEIPEINKITDDNINEIKEVVNGSLQGTNAMGSIVVDDVSGKNLFDGSSMIELRNQVRRYSDGVIVSVSGYYGIKVPVKANTTYIVSSDLADRNKISNLCYFNGNTYISGVTFDSGSLSFTTPNNCNYVTLAVSNEYTWLQIELGTIATTYTPFKQPVKITNVGVKESTTFYANDFKCRNMFIPTMINEGVSINKTNCNLSLVNDEYTFVATGSDMYFGQVTTQNTAYASNKGTLYDVEGLSSISFTITNPLFTTNFITAYDSSKNSLGYTLFNTNTGTYTIPAGAKYITLRAGKNDAVSGTTYKAKIQLEAGPVTTYTPYKNFENEELYSEGEIKIGTWIDGKPLYRKVFTITSLTSSNTNLVDVSGLSIDFAKISGTIITSTGAKFPINLYDSASNYSVIILSDAGYIRGRGAIGSGTLSKCIVILEYTKTTSGTRMLNVVNEGDGDNR